MASCAFNFTIAALAYCCLYPLQVTAHEYWLDPINSSVSLGKSAIVDVRNGQDYSGSAFPYDGTKFKSITVSNADGVIEYQGRLGDYPAIHPEMTKAGLNSISVETNVKLLVYEKWKKFDTFLDYHGLDKVRAAHEQRNLPKNDIKERYFRSAKTIIQVNDTGTLTLEENNADAISTHSAFKATGAEFEMVLLDNPYSRIETFRIKLIYKGEALPNRQTELFWKSGELKRFTAITDSQGIASFNIMGNGDYLLNAVNVIEPEDNDVHWQSHWASITFER